jgi:integrase
MSVYGTFERKKDADDWVREQEQGRSRGVRPAASKETFAEYLESWLAVKAGQLRARTLHDYKGVVDRVIVNPPEGTPLLANVRIDRLTVDDFDALYAHLYKCGGLHKRPLSPVSIRSVHVVLHQALKYAVKKRKLAANPAALADVPTKRRDSAAEEADDEVNAMTQDQAARFLAAAHSDRYSALWKVLLTGGLRPSEALGIKWSDVDFEHGRVQVKRALTRVGLDRELYPEGWTLEETKTKGSRRTVPLPSSTMRALKTWRAVQAKERLQLGAEYRNGSDLVFTTPAGTPLDQSNLYNMNFRRVMRQAELGELGPEPRKRKGQPGPAKARPFKPAFRMYDLRHTCATLLLAAGESLKVVSERLGHASITLTADVYSHVLPTMQQGAVEKLEAMFGTE